MLILLVASAGIMELGTAIKRRYFACGVNQSLLELAHKLREAEVRVNGRTLHAAVPPCSVSAGISSTVDGGRFQFIARGNYMLQNLTSSNYINSSIATITADSVRKDAETKRFCADDELEVMPEEIGEVLTNTHSKKLTLPDRIGPSLWPFLSSIKASVDAEHVRFLEKNQQFYSNYDRSRITQDYVEPLSDGDFQIIIDNAIDAVLYTRESHVSHQSRSSKNEPPVSAAVSVPVAVEQLSMNIAPLSMNTEIDAPSTTFEADNIPPMPLPLPTQPAVISKRYAAAVANPRRFQCGLCPYSTNNRSHVRRHHISVHSDARPYRCYVCGKEFARCENAKVHMISRHPDVPYNVDRLRNSMFFKDDNNLPQNLPNMDLEPSSSSQSSNVPCPNTSFQLQQDVGNTEVSSQWPTDSLDAELKRARLEHQQTIPPWLTFPKIEPKPEQSLPMFGHGNMGNPLLESIPHGMFQAQANTMMNIQSVFGSVNTVKQEPGSHADANLVSNHNVCLYCQCVYPNAAELAKHIAINHSSLSPAIHATPASNPGYVVLQTAAPIFLFPYGSDAMLPNRSPGYHPILPKLPGLSDESRNQNEAAMVQHMSSVPAGTRRSPQNVSNAKKPSASSSSASMISLSTPEKVQESESPSTPASSEGKRERKRQFKTFYCSRCPDRAPFRYEKSFKKHLKQHHFEDRSRKAQKIASKVA